VLILDDVADRFDFSRLNRASVERLPTGVRIPARPTSVGVFPYTRADGTIVRELRPPEEVFDAASLASLADAPVVEGHPAMLTPENCTRFSKGHVSGQPKQDGRFVDAPLVVQDAPTITRIDSGDLSELSCGYTCDTDATPGVFDGRPYDVVQRNIRYNHVGLGPKGWGRQGSDVALRLDGGTSYTVLEEQRKIMKIRFDGKEYESGSEEHILALCVKLDAAESAAKTIQTKLDQAEAALVAERKSLATARSDLAKFDARVSERADLLAKAQAALGETVKLDGKSEREIRSAVVALAYPETKLDGKSDDYVTALFDQAISRNVRADSISRLPEVLRQVQVDEHKQTERADAAPAPAPVHWVMTKEGVSK
jgi:uncharacterized protein